jgi:hypothetical protein
MSILDPTLSREQRGLFQKLYKGSTTLDMNYEGMVEMFEGDLADTFVIICLLVSVSEDLHRQEKKLSDQNIDIKIMSLICMLQMHLNSSMQMKFYLAFLANKSIEDVKRCSEFVKGDVII